MTHIWGLWAWSNNPGPDGVFDVYKGCEVHPSAIARGDCQTVRAVLLLLPSEILSVLWYVQRFSSKRMSDIFDYIDIQWQWSCQVTNFQLCFSSSQVLRQPPKLGITSHLPPYHNRVSYGLDSIDAEQHCQSAFSTNFYTSLPTFLPFRSVNPSLSVAYCLPRTTAWMTSVSGIWS